jgi:hypothetical protein
MPYRSDKHRRIYRTYACGLGCAAAIEAMGKGLAFILFSMFLFMSLLVPFPSWRTRLTMALYYGREAGILFAMMCSFCLPFVPAAIVKVRELGLWSRLRNTGTGLRRQQ